MMGFWHTGYGEFHEPTGLEDFVFTPPPPVRYECEHCSESFLELEALRKHRFEQHPVRQPVLLLRGRPVGALPQILTAPLSPADVCVEDATICLLNSEPVPLEGLGQRLSAMRAEYAELELRNPGANIRCRLDFCVADEGHLAGVEAAFVRLARDRRLDIEAVSRFNNDCRAFASAKTYYDGVSNYLYGVMAKERHPDSQLRQEEYIQRFVRAADELAGFNRPLARSVRALVAFHFNQFDDAEYLAPEGTLRWATGTFRALLQGLPWRFDEALPPEPACAADNLLTDQETLRILADASQGLTGMRDRAHELLALLDRAPSAGYDQLKRILMTCEAMAVRDDLESRDAARKLARTLVSNLDTSIWANAMLERLSTA